MAVHLPSIVERWLHPARHRSARRKLAGIGRPRHVLVVCHGNICRSPYLAAAAARKRPDLDFSSAGMTMPGRPVPPEILTIAARRGLDLAGHRSRVLTRDMLFRTDLVIVMDARLARYIARLGVSPRRIVVAGDLPAAPGETRDIRDPFRQSLDVYEASCERLDRCADVIAAEVARDEAANSMGRGPMPPARR